MPITQGDIKLMQSQRMTDTDDGGGRITGIEILDGQSNAVFDDVTDLDRTTGKVTLAKVFGSVETPDTDTYLSSNLIVAEKPADPNVFVTLFSTGDHDDVVSAARDQIERYVVQGSRAQWELLGNHFTNQRVLLGIQRVEQELPTVGEVYLLIADNGDEQYVRITDVTAVETTYGEVVGNTFVEFQRNRIEMEISAPLDHDFPGGDPTRAGTAMPAGSLRDKSDVFGTEVADAARYWGISQVTAEVPLAALEANVESVYTTLVPSAQSENPITDAALYPSRPDVRPAQSTPSADAFELTYLSSNTVRGFLMRPAVRGSVSISIAGSTFSDQGNGILARTSGAAPFSTLQIDYTTGEVTGSRDTGSGSGTLTGSTTYTSGAAFSGKRVADFTPITLSNRRFNYTETWPNEKPRPGTMVVSFMILGVWYTLEDQGDGQLVGANGQGIGTINFTTGTVAITLPALPDVGTDILWSYIVDIADETREYSGAVAEGTTIEVSIDPGSEPGSIVVDYTSGGSPFQLTDTASVGELAGAGTGTVDYARGIVRIQPSQIPDDATTIDVAYNFAGGGIFVDSSPSISGETYTVTIPGAPLRPGSVTLDFNYIYPWFRGVDVTRSRQIQDDGAGGWKGFVGTIDYATGAITVEVTSTYVMQERYYQSYDFLTQQSVRATQSVPRPQNQNVSGAITVRYKPASASDAGGNVSANVTAVFMQLVDTLEQIWPGSVRFTMGSKEYFDRDGIVYTDFDSATGAGTQVGTIDYNTGQIRLDAWDQGIAAAASLDALLVTAAELTVSEIAFRTPGAPISSQSLQVTITDVAGNLISESSDINDEFNAAVVKGEVNVSTGVARIFFHDGTNPVQVIADTGRYNAIVVTSLPLDKDLIGLDPVRLPADGRVPIFRAGDVAVLHHSAETSFSNPASAGEVINTRPRLASVRILDAADQLVGTDQYTVDLDTGVITLATPLDLAGFIQPIRAVHRIEDMVLISDVDISGRITVTAPISHTFPVGSFLSTALITNDLQARVTNLFDQETWSEQWSDQLVGGEPGAEFNDAGFPIVVTNAGALQQRWAMVFTGATTFDIIGETIGEIGTGSTSTDTAPINPNTGVPYFTIPAGGWGSGWGVGNVLRFNTIGAAAPVWIARTVLQSEPTVATDTFRIQVRGNVNAEA
ncbi:MAG: hypothetical protein AAFY29_10930 [Pseudomonadota bacterium]